jgi:molybdopterin-guanine dinucleotide biosynthesis protein A
MQHRGNKITGILLAGGMSRRMGREKGQLRIGNALLYQYPLAVLEKLCDEVLISTCNTSFSETHRTICDEVKGIGPLGGIYSCLKQSSNELNLVLSYDMPMVNEALFRTLMDEQEDYDLVLPALNDGLPEPLCAVYTKKLTGKLKEMIAAEDYAVRHLRSKCKTKLVPVTRAMPCWHPDLFLNINSREDLEKLAPDFGTEG